MGIIAAPPPSHQTARAHLFSPPKPATRTLAGHNSTTSSMSQGFHQGIFSFSSDGFDRSTSQDQHQHQHQHHQQQQHHVAQQSRRDKLRVQGFDPSGHPLVAIDEEGEEHGIYEPSVAGNMLSEMFDFPSAGPSATELLASQIPSNYRIFQRPGAVGGFSGDWYGANRQGLGMASGLTSLGGDTSVVKQHHEESHQQHQLPGLNANSAAAMQLFLMNPPAASQQHPRSPSPPPPTPPATLQQQQQHHHHAFSTASFGDASYSGGGGVAVEGQGLSLSLSSSLHPFEMAKAEELRVRDGVLFYNNQQHHHHQQQQQHQHSQHASLHLQQSLESQNHGQLQAVGHGHGQQVHMGFGPMGVVNVLRTSKYGRAAQELLEEFCSVGRGQLKGNRQGRRAGHGSSNPNPSHGAASTSAAGSSSSTKDLPPLSPADRFEHQRKKAKLLSMLDEVDRRYNHYCDQMQMVVNSFDAVMGFGAATPYTALAQKAMSRHFRCLKDAIGTQLKQTCELLGDKDGGSSSGITKGETPRLKLLDQSLRQQRAFHQMGMMEQEAWRPQRGLPERSVNLLRAWLFEHFLHPYPSDADKHLLARQTGLSRNQVSNWFINARVRLWKPMVEEMYQQESKELEEEREKTEGSQQTTHSPTQQHHQQGGQGQGHGQHQRPNIKAADNDPSQPPTPMSRQQHHAFVAAPENPPQPQNQSGASSSDDAIFAGAAELVGANAHMVPSSNDMFRVVDYGAGAALGPAAAARMRFGTAGDVSLTLGLRQAGNAAPEKNRFTVRDFGGC